MPNVFSFNQSIGACFVFCDMWKFVIQGNWQYTRDNARNYNFYIFNYGHEQNDEIEYELLAQEGPGTFEILHHKGDSSAILHVSVDGVEIGTLDQYSEIMALNIYERLYFTVPFTGNHSVRLKAATKNPLSSDYYLTCTWLRII